MISTNVENYSAFMLPFARKFSTMRWISNGLLMIRPKKFGSNPETLSSNTFQQSAGEKLEEKIINMALLEFNNMVDLLKDNDIPLEVFDQPIDNISPDIVFPNNWFSVHPEGYIFYYPMESKLRRSERLEVIQDHLSRTYPGFELIDMTWFETEEKFLEGTGSMVFDRRNQRIYCGLSSRSSYDLLKRVAEILNYEAIAFETEFKSGNPIYHTNVFLSQGSDFVVCCFEVIKNPKVRKRILQMLKSDGKNIITISLSQLEAFCGNILEVRSQSGKKAIIMSNSAENAFSRDQLSIITDGRALISSDLECIEKYGGGSARCMVSELF
jgi:hypothetical protein